MPNFRAIKISRGTTQPGYAGATSNIQIVSNTSKTPYLNQATPKNICQNFPTQKIPEIENFKPKQILLSPLSHEIGSTSTGWCAEENGVNFLLTLRRTKGEGGGGEVIPLRFFWFFSKTIKRQHLKFSVAVRLSVQYHGGGMTLRVRPRVKTNREP